MDISLLPSYTKTSATRLSRIGIAPVEKPARTEIFWLNAFSASEKSYPVSKKMHMHTFFEAHFVARGEMTYGDSDGNDIVLSSGDGVIFAPHKSHIVKKMSDDLVKISFTFLPDKASQIYKKVTSACGKSLKIDGKIFACLDEILSESGHASVISSTLIANRVSDLLCYLARLGGDDKKITAVSEACDGESYISVVKQYIDDNESRLLTCLEVARHCHFNEKYLGRVFKRHMGVTLLEYIHLRKLACAEKMLENESLSLADVSVRLGFANEYYFNSFFKRMSGITPGQYRKFLLSGRQKQD